MKNWSILLCKTVLLITFPFWANNSVVHSLSSSSSLSMKSTTTGKEIYNIPNSGWSSPKWNWGSASGTGHDCAMICRNEYGTKSARAELVQDLLNDKDNNAEENANESSSIINFEEVKLVLGLAWQNGRWDGTDGGKGGYGDVLYHMAQADRYEIGSDIECSTRFINDMSKRFHLLKPTEEEMKIMKSITTAAATEQQNQNELDTMQRKCCGLVLISMGFIQNGL